MNHSAPLYKEPRCKSNELHTRQRSVCSVTTAGVQPAGGNSLFGLVKTSCDTLVIDSHTSVHQKELHHSSNHRFCSPGAQCPVCNTATAAHFNLFYLSLCFFASKRTCVLVIGHATCCGGGGQYKITQSDTTAQQILERCLRVWH